MASYQRRIARALANAFLLGPWQPSALTDLGRRVLGARPRWLTVVVRKLLAAFPEPPQGHDALTRVSERVFACGAFQRSFHGRHRPRISRVLAAPPRMEEGPWPVRPLDTPADLAHFIDVSEAELRWLADAQGYLMRSNEPRLAHYHRRWIEKRSGGHRLIESPKPRIKTAQRRILREILDRIPAHDAAVGFIRGGSPLAHAKRHAGSAWLVRVDLVDFFSSVRFGRVYRLFRHAGYPMVVARLLAALCTTALPLGELEHCPKPQHSGEVDALSRQRRKVLTRHLPQGAPTSPALANLCAYRLDVRLSSAAEALGLTYSRYADDLAFSGADDFGPRRDRFVAFAGAIALEEGFEVNFRKTRIMHRSRAQQLCGLVVNERPNVPRAEYDRLKAILTNCRRHGPASQNRGDRVDLRAHLRGRIAWVQQITPTRGQKLLSLFDAVDWG